MTHKIPAYLIGTDSKRIESHQLMTANAGVTGDDLTSARQFLEHRARILGHRPTGSWHMSNGEIRVWCERGTQ